MTVNNDKAPDGQKLAATGSVEKQRKRVYRHELIHYFISLFLFILLVAVAYYFINENEETRETSQSVITKAGSQYKQFNQQINVLEQQMKQLQERIDTLSGSVSELYENQAGSNEDWALAEVEYLLVIATHRLVLEQDVPTALKAMEAASLRLEALGDSGLVPVREQITSDMNKLRAVNVVDITGLSIYLADLAERVDDLPLKKLDLQEPGVETGQSQQKSTESSGSGLKNIFSKIWLELKSLVVIRKTGDVKKVLLLPDEAYFLYQNLRLELENARISVLRRNTENLHASIGLITDWLQTYFDVSDSSVANVLDSLRKMVKLQLDPELPDISSSLETLRAYMHQRDSAQLHMQNSFRPVS